MKKTILIVCFGLASSLAGATETSNVSTFAYSATFSPCRNWNYVRIQGGGSGYLCSSYPGISVTVPDYNDYANTVNQLEQRIVDLEQRLQKLENPDNGS